MNYSLFWFAYLLEESRPRTQTLEISRVRGGGALTSLGRCKVCWLSENRCRRLPPQRPILRGRDEHDCPQALEDALDQAPRDRLQDQGESQDKGEEVRRRPRRTPSGLPQLFVEPRELHK